MTQCVFKMALIEFVKIREDRKERTYIYVLRIKNLMNKTVNYMRR